MILKMKNGDSKARDTLVMANLKLVLSIIQKINCKNTDADDIFQVGCIGLIKALNNFDPSLNIQFSTYGVVMIMGEIKRFIRDNNTLRVSRRTKDLAYRALSYKEQYSRENGTEPTRNEVAEVLGISPFQISSALEALSPAVSLYEPAFGDEADGAYLMDQISGESFEDEFCSKTVILDVLRRLKAREKQIINLRYIQGKTQTQVASIIGISQAQVSRIEKNIISDVKKELDC